VTPVRAYGFGLLAFLVCTLLRLALDPWLGTSVPFLLFIPGIIVAAGYGGVGPGLFVTMLSAATAFVRYVEPVGSCRSSSRPIWCGSPCLSAPAS